jgi:hypothetical protein
MIMRWNFTFLITDSKSPEFLESEYIFFMAGTGRMTKVEIFEVDKKMIEKVFHVKKKMKDTKR